MNAGKFGQASKLLKELLSSEPADQKARRLSATLNLKLGNRITAKTLFETLVKEALGSQDRRLAESLLREYLEAGPRYVPFLQLLGQVCEENGNRKAAAVEYGKALTVLIEDEDTDDAELPAKLYAKIKALNPTEPVLGQFATMFEPPKPAEPAQPVAEPSAQEPPVKAKGKGKVKEEVSTGRSAAPVKPSEVKPAAPRREGAKKGEASRAPAAQPSAKPHAPPPAAPAEPVVEPRAPEIPVEAKGAAVASVSPPSEVPKAMAPSQADAPVASPEVEQVLPLTPQPEPIKTPQAPPASPVQPMTAPEVAKISPMPKDLAARRLSATQKLESGDHLPARNMFAALVHEALESQDRRLAESLLREYLMAGPPYVPFLELLGRLCEEKGNHRAAAEEYGKALQVLIGDQAAGDPDLSAKLYAKVKELNPASPLLPRFAAGFEPPPPAAQADEPVVEPTALSSTPPLEVPEQRVSGDVEASVEPVEIKAAPPVTPEPHTLTEPHAPPALPTEVPVEAAPAAAAPLENQKTPDLQPALRAPEAVTALPAEPVVSDRPEEVQDKPVEVVPEQKVEKEISPPPSEEKPHEPSWKTDFRFLESTAPPKRSYKPVAEAPLSAPPEARGVSPITAGSGADAAAQDTMADVSEEWVAAEPEAESVVPDSPAPSADTGGPETLSFTTRTSVPTPLEEIQDDLPAIGSLEELHLDETNLIPADVDTVSEGELEDVSVNELGAATTLDEMPTLDIMPGVAGDAGETAVRRWADEAEESVNVPQAPAPQEPVIEFHDLEGMPHQEVTHARSTPSFVLTSAGTATREAGTDQGQEEEAVTVPSGVTQHWRTVEQTTIRTIGPDTARHASRALADRYASRRRTGPVMRVAFPGKRAVIGLFTLIMSLTVVPLGLTALVWLGLGQSPNSAFQNLTKTPARALQAWKKNGYFLLLGFGVEETRDPLAAGYTRWEATGSSGQPQCFEGGLRPPLPLRLDAEATTLSDWFQVTDPVAQFKKMKGIVRTWSTKHEALLARYRKWLGMPFDDWGYGRFANPDCTQILTAHRLYVADGFARGLSIGLSLLEQDVKKWRAVLPRAKTLSMKLMAAAAVNDDARILSGLLNRKEVSDQKISRLLKLMKPLELPERSLRWPLQHDLALRAKLLDSETPLSMSKEPSLLVQVLEHMPLPRQRTLNAYADYYEKVIKASDRPRSDWPSLYQFANTPAKMPWDFVINPVDNLLPARLKVDWEHRARELLETDARLRLVLLQARLRGTPKKELASRIARSGPRYDDPFTGFSMVYNPSKSRLYSVGKDGEDNNGDLTLDVSVVLAR